MHTTIVHVHVKREFVTAFIEATHSNHHGSIQEPGCRRFDVLQSPSDPCYFLLYEAYESSADAAAHKETAHYLAWRSAVEPMMSIPRQSDAWVGLLP
jgi:autoinducer 2-degrading protein